jgi:hypothetical protein
MQPRVLAQTAVIERHVIRSEVPGIVIDPVAALLVERSGGSTPLATTSDAGSRWRLFVDRFLAEVSFDDPGQPLPRSGGTGWIRVPLPGGLYVNVYRSSGQNRIGAEVRFPGTDGAADYGALTEERADIAAEFAAQGFDPPDWIDGEVPVMRITAPSPHPWNEAVEADQRDWMARAANQFVNSLRPRMQRLGQELAA